MTTKTRIRRDVKWHHLDLLALGALTNGPRFEREILDSIEEATGVVVPEPNLCREMPRLRSLGLVEFVVDGTDKRRRTYRITRKGAEVLADQVVGMQSFVDLHPNKASATRRPPARRPRLTMDEAQRGCLSLLETVPALTVVEALQCVGRVSHTWRNWRHRDPAFRAESDRVLADRRRGLTPVAAIPPALPRRPCGSCGFRRLVVRTVIGDRCLICLSSEIRTQPKEAV
jgi:DNA-binding PadR family transcriptional regulator